jgi:hydroxylamine reductase
MSVAPVVVDAVKTGKIKHFFLIGGCDGAEGERNYFRDVALNSPKDTVILTLACGKYRFNKMEFGEVAGLPRLLDIGQCNDAYSAIQIAGALANAFNTDVNGLPLSFVISWFEQKAVAVLLTLLHLGVKNIYLGPHLPAFATPNMLDILVKTFDLRPTGNASIDLPAMLAPKKKAAAAN